MALDETRSGRGKIVKGEPFNDKALLDRLKMIDDFVSDHCMEIPTSLNDKYNKLNFLLHGKMSLLMSKLDSQPFLKLFFCALPDRKGFRKVMRKKFENFFLRGRGSEGTLQSNCAEGRSSSLTCRYTS